MSEWLTRVGWFIAIWIGGVALLALVAYGIRLAIMPA